MATVITLSRTSPTKASRGTVEDAAERTFDVAPEDYTKAKETMLERTHIAEAPRWVVQAVDKKKARLNCISHLLSLMPYAEGVKPTIELPARVRNPDYIRHPVPDTMVVPEVY